MERCDYEEYRGCTINIYYDESPEDPRNWSDVATFVCEHHHDNLGDEHDIEKAVENLFSDYVSDKAIIEYFVKSRGAKLIPGEEDDSSDYYYEYKTSYCGKKYTHYIDADSEMQGEDGIAEQMADELDLNEKLQLIDETGEIAILPISMYEHSGITLWLGSTDGHPDARWDCSSIGFVYVEKSTAEKEGMLNPGEKYDNDWKKWAYDMMEGEMETYDQFCRGEVYGYMIEDENGEEASDELLCGCWGYYGDQGKKDMIEEAKGEIDSYLEKKAKTRETNIQTIICNMTQLAGMTFVYGCTSYHIGKDMFGYEYIEKAPIKNSKVGVYDVVNIQTLPDDLLNDIVKQIKVAA